MRLIVNREAWLASTLRGVPSARIAGELRGGCLV